MKIISLLLATCVAGTMAKHTHPMKRIQKYGRDLQAVHEKNNDATCFILILNIFGSMMNETNACGRANVTLFDDDEDEGHRCNQTDSDLDFASLCSPSGRECTDLLLNGFQLLEDYGCMDSGGDDCEGSEVRYQNACLPPCSDGCCDDETCISGACVPNDPNDIEEDGDFDLSQLRSLFEFACAADENGNICTQSTAFALENGNCAAIQATGCCYSTYMEMISCLGQGESVAQITSACPLTDPVCTGTPTCSAARVLPLLLPLFIALSVALFFKYE